MPTAIFAIVVTGGFRPRTEQLHQSRFSRTSRSILHGHIDVPRIAIDPEGILIDGKYYGYFGPTPALLRLPVMLFDSAPDPFSQPFLAPLYMTVAFLLAAFAIAGIASMVGLDGWLAAGFTFIALAGSALMPLSARAGV